MLDLCTQAKSQKGVDFLPLRAHIFQRAVNGVWACANGECPGCKETRLDDSDWPFGKIFLERRTICDVCDCPVFEVVQCGECGAEHLSAQEVSQKGAEWLNQRQYPQDEDEFQQELEPVDVEDQEDESQEEGAGESLNRLIVFGEAGNPVSLLPDGKLSWGQNEGFRINLIGPDEKDRLCCPSCQSPESYRMFFRPVCIGAPFLLPNGHPHFIGESSSF